MPESLLAAHRKLLRVQWRCLPTPDLWRHLHHVVGAEHQRHARTIDGVRYFGDRRLQPQLRWRRLAVARELADRAVSLDPLLFAHALPHGQWPGLARLLGRLPD